MTRTDHQLEGPEINGQRTIVSFFSTDQLQQSVYLPNLLSTINLAFGQAHKSQPELGMSTGDRLGSTEELLATLTHDPESFVVIVSRPRDINVLGTASCRRYLGTPMDTTSPWLRRLPVTENSCEWELKMMATHPTAQGQGLARYMMKLTEKEILDRVKRSLTTSLPSPVDIRLVLSTPTEINGAFYVRRGYQQDYEVERGEGFNFHIVFMSKSIGRFP